VRLPVMDYVLAASTGHPQQRYEILARYGL
jgi:hypothetical protein